MTVLHVGVGVLVFWEVTGERVRAKITAAETGGVLNGTCSKAETALLKFYGLARSQRPFLRWTDGVSQPCSVAALSSPAWGEGG